MLSLLRLNDRIHRNILFKKSEKLLNGNTFSYFACEAEARHMYCFSSSFIGVGGGVNFFVFRSFSQKL